MEVLDPIAGHPIPHPNSLDAGNGGIPVGS